MLRSSTIQYSMRVHQQGLWQGGEEDIVLEARHDAPSINVHEEACGQEDTTEGDEEVEHCSRGDTRNLRRIL